MPQIGWLEILIIVSIAIIVVGPKDFPLMLKKMGSWIGSIKRYVSDVQNQVSEITDNSIEDENSIKKTPEKKDPVTTPPSHAPAKDDEKKSNQTELEEFLNLIKKR